jgi:hypothetical protein
LAISKESGRPFPRVSDDDVVDYLVTEAVTLKYLQERTAAEEEAKKQAWKKNTDDLRQRVGA